MDEYDVHHLLKQPIKIAHAQPPISSPSHTGPGGYHLNEGVASLERRSLDPWLYSEPLITHLPILHP